MTVTTIPTRPDLTPILDEYVDAWRQRDTDRIMALHAENTRFVNHVGAEPALGRDAVREAFVGIFAAFPDFSADIHRTIVGSRHWVLDWTMRSGGLALHCFDLVDVDDDGLVTNKETWVDVEHFNEMVETLTSMNP